MAQAVKEAKLATADYVAHRSQKRMGLIIALLTILCPIIGVHRFARINS